MIICDFCDDTMTVITGGPDYFGNYDSDDCPRCATYPLADEVRVNMLLEAMPSLFTRADAERFVASTPDLRPQL